MTGLRAHLIGLAPRFAWPVHLHRTWPRADLRSRLARLLDKSHRLCWADLYDFGVGDKRNPFPSIKRCRADAESNSWGCCWCGKIQDNTIQSGNKWPRRWHRHGR